MIVPFQFRCVIATRPFFLCYFRLVSISRCSLTDGSSTALLPVQQPSPGSENICPSTVTSIKVDLCMKDSNLGNMAATWFSYIGTCNCFLKVAVEQICVRIKTFVILLLDCSEWMTTEPFILDKFKTLLSHSIENHCLCTVPPSYIQGQYPPNPGFQK